MEKFVDRIEEGLCPFCGHRIDMGDFTDPLSIREYHISGLCQSCQDEWFVEEAE